MATHFWYIVASRIPCRHRLREAGCLDLFPRTNGGSDINMDVSSHIEVVSLWQKMSNTRERTITLDVEKEDYDVELTYKKKAEE